MWEEIYEKHYPELLRYASAAIRSEAEAQDIAQEVFLKALQNADTFEDLGPSQRRAWLFRTLKNLMCDRFRRAQLENAYLETLEPDAAAPDSRMQEIENRLLLARLSPEDRALFHLRYEEGYNASELSEMLHIPAGTIRARLSRMRKHLKQLMEE
ncbi:MAG: RNA polymerase sigma factor [Oscillospiraceae bacterium]|nr:RNA polymerase sigma factor [Oscillospiraceae bacterium]